MTFGCFYVFSGGLVDFYAFSGGFPGILGFWVFWLFWVFWYLSGCFLVDCGFALWCGVGIIQVLVLFGWFSCFGCFVGLCVFGWFFWDFVVFWVF